MLKFKLDILFPMIQSDYVQSLGDVKGETWGLNQWGLFVDWTQGGSDRH